MGLGYWATYALWCSPVPLATLPLCVLCRRSSDYLVFVSRLSIKAVNTPSLGPVQTYSLATKLPWLNIGEWLADVQRLPILPKPLNNLSNLIFKMFTVSADSCTVQEQHQGECTYPLLSQILCKVQWEHWETLMRAVLPVTRLSMVLQT